MNHKDFFAAKQHEVLVATDAILKSNINDEDLKKEIIDYLRVRIPAGYNSVEIYFTKAWKDIPDDEKLRILEEDIARKQKMLDAITDSNVLETEAYSIIEHVMNSVLRRAKNRRTRLERRI